MKGKNDLMAYIAVTSLMKTLELEFLQPKPRIVLRNTERIKCVHENLGYLQDFLEKKPIANALFSEIRDMALRAEDDIALAIHPPRWLCSRYYHIFAFVQRTLPFAVLFVFLSFVTRMFVKVIMGPFYLVVSFFIHCARSNQAFDGAIRETVELIKRLLNITASVYFAVSTFIHATELHWRFNRIFGLVIIETEKLRKSADQLANNFQIQYPPLARERFSVGSSSAPGEEIVGHTQEFEMLKKQLIHPSPKDLQVLSIVGMGGIGKTTLAKSLYHDASVMSHFDILGWTTASEECSMRQVLFDLCSSVMSMTKESENANEGELANSIRRRLLGHRYLIVVDDIWSNHVWDTLQRCFSDAKNGSRILLTTPLTTISDYACASEYSCNMPFLDQNQSWNLFCQKVVLERSLSSNFEIIGRQVVKECKGLPFAIVVVAGLLSNVKRSTGEWHKIASQVKSDLNDQCSRVLALSYNHLPYHLKSCFLYMGIFEDKEIPVKKLIRLWVAEGVVKGGVERNLEKDAQKYLKDLIDRSLILIGTRRLDGEIKTCRMHDIVHNFCLRESSEVNLLYRVTKGGSQQIPLKHAYRWLSIQQRCPASNVLVSCSRTNSMFYFSDKCERTLFSYGIGKGFVMLRVLDIGVCKCSCISTNFDLESLVFLRYLAYNYKYLYKISVAKNRNLQTLIIYFDWGFFPGSYCVPLRITGSWEFPELRHLIVKSRKYLIETTKVNQESLQLQTISWLHSFQCTKKFFSKVPNVKDLEVFCCSNNSCSCFEEEEIPDRYLDNLRYLKYLERLTIQSNRCDPICLPLARAFPERLKILKLVGTQLTWEDISSVVGSLPNLQVLKLMWMSVLGEEWTVTDNAFPRLKCLYVHSEDLKHWDATCDVFFPVLERLFLEDCCKLEELPIQFADITTLQLIQIEDCHSSLATSAKGIQQARELDYGNDALVVQTRTTWKRLEWVDGRSSEFYNLGL